MLRGFHVRVKPELPGLSVSRKCPFSTTRELNNDEATLNNLKIGRHTRVIFQGFTGKLASQNAAASLEWGTNIVGGVKPGYEGEFNGLPCLPTVRKAAETLRPDATGVYVAAQYAAGAIEEAIEAEIPLIVAVAEHIPLHDMIRIHSMLKTQSKSRLVGANSPGIISAVGKCRIGFQPLSCFKPGRVGIVARSGTLSYEAAASTFRAGLGQSLCIGVGGDILPGTSLVDGLKVLAEDTDTEAIALVGEIGGTGEMEAADWIKEYRQRVVNPKFVKHPSPRDAKFLLTLGALDRPIVALIAGKNAVPGRIMGHQGAFTLPGEPKPTDKASALEAAGAAIINYPSRFGPVLKSMLSGSNPTGVGVAPPGTATQIRALHTFVRRRVLTNVGPFCSCDQKRSIYLSENTALDLLRLRGVPISDQLVPEAPHRLLAVSINRSSRSPCIVASPSRDASLSRVFDFDYHNGAADPPILAIATALGLDAKSVESLTDLIHKLVTLFKQKEAFLLETHVIEDKLKGVVSVTAANLGFDDAAFHKGGRQQDIHALRDVDAENPHEVGLEKEGIIYVKMKGEDANIGTVVNGAGLAMITVDALADAGGRAANFLDMGGKATRETVKRSFEAILADERVKCIFVNIFGGLTRGDMIGQGIVMAFSQLDMTVPVVVRIRGTNEKDGLEIIKESGFRMFAFDDFDEAAAKAIELANGTTTQPRPGRLGC